MPKIMIVEAADGAGRLAGGPRAVIILALGACLAAFAYLMWRTAVLQPYSDMFDWVARYYRFRSDGDAVGFLLTPHNVHRLAWTFGVLALDIEGFGARGYLFVAVGAACLLATAALLAREARAAAGPALGLAGAGFAAMLTLLPGNILDASLPINVTYVQAVVFAVLAIVLAEPEGAARRSGTRSIGVLAAACAAGLGNAAGLAVWPALVFGAWRGRADRRWRLLTLGVGAAFTALYVAGPAAPGAAAALVGPGGLARGLHLALSYLGLPWTRAVPGLGEILGLTVLALSLGAVALKGKAGAPRAERVAVQLILFSLATAVMASIGRTEASAPSEAPLRYAVFLAPLHVGLLMLTLPHLGRLWTAHRRPVEAAIGLAAIAMVGQQLVMGASAIRVTDANRRLIADFESGRRTPQMALTVHPNLPYAQALSLRMRRDGIYQGGLHLGAAAR